MIFCKRCGYEGVYTGKSCPNCNGEIELTHEEIQSLLSELQRAKATGEYETVVEDYKILADFGHTEAEREYARLLEKGGIVPRDLNAAMDYFCRAARKNDPYAAYRYSSLISRASDEAGNFWLIYSALLGCAEAYLSAAEALEKAGKISYSNYYYYLAASCDEVDAIVALAEKYYTGTGLTQSAEYAKWYMEKLVFPPFHALKLAYKLRGVKSKEAPTIKCESPDGLVRMLSITAKKLNFDTALYNLLGILSEHGDAAAACELGGMLLNGEGTEKNETEAIRTLTRAAAMGNCDAYDLLGEIYLHGETVERNPALAIECFNQAAKLGKNAAYEKLGDLYHSLDYEGRDVARAYEYYTLASNGGIESAGEKAERINEARLSFYERAEAAIAEPEVSFKCYGICALMGYAPATLKLAKCYAQGIGTKKQANLAFHWYTEAANANLTDGYYELGKCYARGIGTAFDFELAMKYLKIANRMGDKRAEGEIIRLYENKKCSATRRLYSTAMRLIYQKKFSAAVSYLALADKLDYPKATYTLGCLYEFGRGVECNKKTAYTFYDKAMRKEFFDHRSTYKLTVLKMLKK